MSVPLLQPSSSQVCVQAIPPSDVWLRWYLADEECTREAQRSAMPLTEGPSTTNCTNCSCLSTQHKEQAYLKWWFHGYRANWVELPCKLFFPHLFYYQGRPWCGHQLELWQARSAALFACSAQSLLSESTENSSSPLENACFIEVTVLTRNPTSPGG